MTKLLFELVTPEKLLISEEVVMVTVPGGEGEYGVLIGHAPMITTLKPGVINVYGESENTISEKIFVSGGFAEVNAERCTVLVEEATYVNDLDKPSLDLHMQMLNGNLTNTATDTERKVKETEIAVTQAKLQAVAA